MKKTIFLIAMVLISSALAAQTDLTSGEQEQGYIRLGVYTREATGTESWVREFDGRDFGRYGIEELNTYGFSGPTQYWLDARDLIIGDEDLNFSMASGNLLGISMGTSKLTHRLFRVPSINPFIAGEYTRLALAAPIPGDTGDALIDLSPGINFRLNRRVNDLALDLTPRGSQGNRYIVSWWQELEGGTRQVVFRARAAAVDPDTLLPVIANRKKAEAALPIDRSTTQAALGTDLRLGKLSVLNYRYSSTEFSDSQQGPVRSLSNVFPLNTETRFSSTTNSNVFRGRSKLTDHLYFTGTYGHKNRRNDTAAVPVATDRVGNARGRTSYDNAGDPLNSRVTVQSTNLALTFLATDALSVTGRWRRYDLDNEVPPVLRLSGDPPVAATEPDNMSLSREVTSTEVNASYTGIPKAYLKLGFENRDTDRRTAPTHPTHEEEFEHPFTNDHTEANIVRLGARYYPTQGLSLQANFEDWNISDPGYAGTPTDRRKLNVNATYMVKANFALYGDYAQVKDENDEVRVASIPTIVTAPDPPLTAEEEEAYLQERENAAGQGYKNDVKTTVLGAWYGLSPKLTLDTYWSKSSVDSGATLIFGNEPAFLPHLAPDFTPFTADNDQWSFGANYAISPRWRLNGRFATSTSAGKTLIDVLPGGLGPTWTPVDVDSNRWTLGFAYDISAKDRLLLDFSVLDWKDNIDSSQDGRFNVWRLAWSSSF